MESNWECNGCGKILSDYVDEVGYDGPADAKGNPMPEDDHCNPFMRWVVLCKECAEARGITLP